MIRTLLTIVFCFSSALLVAADPPAGSKAAEFAKIDKERSDLITASRLEIERKQAEFDEKIRAVNARGFAAAEGAYAEAPNADPKVLDALAGSLLDHLKRDDYESAFRIGKLLMDNKCSLPEAPAMAGVAAYCVNEYDLAEPWLKTPQASLALERICRELPRRHFADFPNAIAVTKAGWAKEKKIREAEGKANDLPRVLMKTSAGNLEIELFENEAPNTVLNFITLLDKKFYDGLTFHRVLPGFMAQGGDPKGDGEGGPGYTIPDECSRPDHRLHFRGSLSMAHSNEPDSGGSQFFVCFDPTTYLNGKYTVFGRVINGMDVLAKIKRRDPDSLTKEAPDKIVEAKVTRRRAHPYDVKNLKKSGKSD